MVVFYLSCLLTPRNNAVQVDERVPLHEENSCTIAAHRFDVASWHGTHKKLMKGDELHDEFDSCCEKESLHGIVSCSSSHSVDIEWLSV